MLCMHHILLCLNKGCSINFNWASILKKLSKVADARTRPVWFEPHAILNVKHLNSWEIALLHFSSPDKILNDYVGPVCKNTWAAEVRVQWLLFPKLSFHSRGTYIGRASMKNSVACRKHRMSFMQLLPEFFLPHLRAREENPAIILDRSNYSSRSSRQLCCC